MSHSPPAPVVAIPPEPYVSNPTFVQAFIEPERPPFPPELIFNTNFAKNVQFQRFENSHFTIPFFMNMITTAFLSEFGKSVRLDNVHFRLLFDKTGNDNTGNPKKLTESHSNDVRLHLAQKSGEGWNNMQSLDH